MTIYRFRVTGESDPTSLWRDIVVGTVRTLDEFQSVLNRSVGLYQAHLWFFGTDRDYWRHPVRYRRPEELELEQAGPTMDDKDEYVAAETTMGDMVRRVKPEERDRICYLFDYTDEWRFYGIHKEIDEDAPSDRKPEEVQEKGDPVEQYPSRGERL